MSRSLQNKLQTLSEDHAQQRQQFEAQITELNRQLRSSALQLSGLSNALQEARLQIDPDYEALLQQARDEAARELRQLRGEAGGPFAAYSDPANAQARAQQNMPRMYDSFLNGLGIPGTERMQLMDAMQNFAAQRYQMLGALLQGSLEIDQAQTLFGANALASSMAGELSETQQDNLRRFDLLLKEDTLREIYDQALLKSGVALTGTVQDKVIETLLDEIVSAENNWAALVADDGSMISAHRDKIAAFERARERLATSLSGEQLGQLDRFIVEQSGAVDVILEAFSDSRGRVNITQARIDVDDLPQ